MPFIGPMYDPYGYSHYQMYMMATAAAQHNSMQMQSQAKQPIMPPPSNYPLQPGGAGMHPFEFPDLSVGYRMGYGAWHGMPQQQQQQQYRRAPSAGGGGAMPPPPPPPPPHALGGAPLASSPPGGASIPLGGQPRSAFKRRNMATELKVRGEGGAALTCRFSHTGGTFSLCI